MEVGFSAFVETVPSGVSGGERNAHKRLLQILELIRVADEVGLDVVGLGEHHRADYAVSSPSTVLAAAASITKNIKLGTAVTVLSSEDPVRVYQQFSTLDLISSGRAEIMAGRGSFIESFPLFGFDLKDYNQLFEERLELLIQIIQNEKVTWSGKTRAPLKDAGIYPRSYQERIPLWVAVGGTPESVVRAAHYDLPVTLAIIGGSPDQFSPLAEYYRQTRERFGYKAADYQLGVHSPFFVGDDSKTAKDDFFGPYSRLFSKIGRERGWGPVTRGQFDHGVKEGALFAGNVDEVIAKALHYKKVLGMTRFVPKIILDDALPFEKMVRAIQLLGEKIKPALQ
jgi:probable LLM family oxidoreductase